MNACSVCGAPLANVAEFCPACGSPVGRDEDELQPRRRSIVRALIAALLVFVLLFGSILTALVFIGGNGGLPPGAERDFMTACVQGGSSPDSCRCALAELGKRYTREGFAKAVDQIARTGVAPQPFLEALQTCGRRPASDQTPA